MPNSEPLTFKSGPAVGFDLYLDDRLVDSIIPHDNSWLIEHRQRLTWRVSREDMSALVVANKVVSVSCSGDQNVVWEAESNATALKLKKTQRWIFAFKPTDRDPYIFITDSKEAAILKAYYDQHNYPYTIQDVKVTMPPEVK